MIHVSPNVSVLVNLDGWTLRRHVLRLRL
jgi:hypothetical protein